MRNALALHLVLLAALLGSCSSQLITSRVLTTQPDDNAEEARSQEEIVPASKVWADRASPEAAVNQRCAPGTPPRFLPDAVLAGHTDKVWHAAFSPDGSRIVTASDDKTARLWDSEGKQLAVLEGHKHAEVRHAEFSPDGSRILTASGDGTARLWDSEGSGQRMSSTSNEGVVRSGQLSRGWWVDGILLSINDGIVTRESVITACDTL